MTEERISVPRHEANQPDTDVVSERLPEALKELIYLPSTTESLERFRADAERWLLFVLKPEYIPRNIVELFVPVYGRLCILGGAGLERVATGKDGFVAWYEIDDLLLHITDTRFDLRVLVWDRSAAPQAEPGERKVAALKAIRTVCLDRMFQYPDGEDRKVIETNRGSFSIYTINWQAPSADKDVRPFAARATEKLSSFWNCYSDGETSILVFTKVLSTSVEGYDSPYSRFRQDALFEQTEEDVTALENTWLEESLRAKERRRIAKELLGVLDNDELRRQKPAVFEAVIEALGELASVEVVPRLCDFVELGTTEDEFGPAVLALRKLGKPAAKLVIAYVSNQATTDGQLEILSRIIQEIVGTAKAREMVGNAKSLAGRDPVVQNRLSRLDRSFESHDA